MLLSLKKVRKVFDFKTMDLKYKLGGILLMSLMPYLSVMGQYKVTHYSSASGFPHDFAYGLMQDEDGLLWIGTDAGLARFNGTAFETFTVANGLRSNFVIDIVAMDSARKILATWGGGLHQLNEQGKISPLLPQDSLMKISTVIPHKKGLICELNQDEFLLYRKEKGYRPQHFRFYADLGSESLKEKRLRMRNPNTRIKKVSGRFFIHDISSPDVGIWELHSDFSIDLFADFIEGQPILDFGLYRPGVFFALGQDGLLLFSQEGQAMDTLSYPEIPYPFERFHKRGNLEVLITQLPKGGHQVHIKNTDNGTIFSMDKSYLNQKMVSEVLIDRDGTVWVSTFGSGLFKLQPESTAPFINLKKGGVFSDWAEDDNNGFFVLEENSLCFMDTSLANIQCRPTTKNYKLIQRNGELFVPLKDTDKQEPFSLGGRKINFYDIDKLIVHSEDSIVYHKNYIYIIRNGEPLTLLHSDMEKKLQHLSIKDVIINRDTLWCASNLGVFAYDLPSLRLVKRITKKDGLGSNLVTDLDASKAGVWATTLGGTYRIDTDTLSSPEMRWDIAPRQTNALVMDRFQQLWVATQKGLTLYGKDEVYHFDRSNGLSSSSLTGIKKDSQGRLWLLGNNGIDILENKAPFQPTEAAIIQIEQKGAVFDIELIDFSGSNNTIAYRINTNLWKDFKSERLDLSDYKYGNYHIQFRTRKQDSNWRYSTLLHFQLTPPWYKRWYTLLLLALWVLSVLSFLVLRYLKKLKKRNAFLKEVIDKSDALQNELEFVRENIAQDFHDELGNKLAGITVSSEVILQEMAPGNELISQQLKRIHKDATSLYKGIKDFIWSIDSNNDNLGELTLYLKDFGDELFDNSGIRFFFSPDPGLMTIRLPYYWSRHLLLMYKEAMTNVLKHSGADRVDLHVRILKNHLCILLRDNGGGFDPNTVKRSNGIDNMENRSSSIGGKVRFRNRNGTSVFLIVALDSEHKDKPNSTNRTDISTPISHH